MNREQWGEREGRKGTSSVRCYLLFANREPVRLSWLLYAIRQN
jgi:hypothetical protein